MTDKMNETNKLYETNGMLKECRARVTGYEEVDGCHYITLDQTIFAPEGGGQKADTGYLIKVSNEQINTVSEGNASQSNGRPDQAIAILDGQDKVKGCTLEGPVYRISRPLDSSNTPGNNETPGISEPLRIGDEVLCKLDWEQRFMRMQQHSGEHIVSGLVHKHFGYDNISFHLSDTEPIIMCFNGVLTKEDALRIETLANEAIYVNLPIQVSFPSKEELESITYRSKIEIKGQVRLVTIPDIDVCACCAPHLMSTGQVGLIKVLSIQSYKGGTQLNVLCGARALAQLQTEHEVLTNLAKEYSTSAVQVTNAILTQRDELKTATEKLAAITEAQLLEKIEAMTEADAPCLFAPTLTPHAMKICYNALCAKYDRFCGVFNGSDETGYQFYAGHPKQDSTILAAKMREGLQAKGGGSKEMIQGKLQKKEEEIILFFKNSET